jgi:hypothetical protein
LELKKINEDFSVKKEHTVYLPEEYKFCKWSSRGTNAKVTLDKKLVLETSFFGIGTSFYDREKYDSIFVNDISQYHCFLPDIILDIIKETECRHLVMRPVSGRECGEKNSVEKFLISRKKECEKDSVAQKTAHIEECEEDIEEKNEENLVESKEYNDVFFPILKNSIGKTFKADITVEVKCPRDINDTNYSEKKTLKINRPIVVSGECK